jgi:hypothetical protein
MLQPEEGGFCNCRIISFKISIVGNLIDISYYLSLNLEE